MLSNNIYFIVLEVQNPLFLPNLAVSIENKLVKGNIYLIKIQNTDIFLKEY